MAKQAIDLFGEIENLNEIVVILFFNACAQLGTAEALDLTKNVLKRMPESFYLHSNLLTSLLDALMKCEDVAHAQSLFNESKNKTLSMYAVMMKGNNHLNSKHVHRDFSSRLCEKQYGEKGD